VIYSFWQKLAELDELQLLGLALALFTGFWPLLHISASARTATPRWNRTAMSGVGCVLGSGSHFVRTMTP